MAKYTSTHTGQELDAAITAVAGKQDTLVSGTNIKTIHGESILGSGNIDIVGPTGAIGPTGPMGPTGGMPNIDISSNGTWIINGFDTGVHALGPTGAAGQLGPTGVSPSIGNNGH